MKVYESDLLRKFLVEIKMMSPEEREAFKKRLKEFLEVIESEKFLEEPK